MCLCNKCLENRWKFVKVNEFIRATCQYCGNEVEFEAKQEAKAYAKDFCLKCKARLKVYNKSRVKPRKAYYYKGDNNFLFVKICPKCKTIWLNPKDIVYV